MTKFPITTIQEIRQSLKNDAAGNSRATMTDLDLACDILDAYVGLMERLKDASDACLTGGSQVAEELCHEFSDI